MGHVSIVGGGQAGTLAGIGLLEQGHEVTIIEGLSPDEMRKSNVRSTACIWQSNAQFESDLGLGFWDDVNTIGHHIRLQFRDLDGTVINSIHDKLHEGVVGIDQRTKFPAFMEEFQRRGGDLQIGHVNADDLEDMAETSDVVLVAAGKGEIGKFFPTDEARTIFDAPPRMNCAVVLKNFKEFEDIEAGALKFEFYKNTGDWFALPFYAENIGYCRAIVFQAVPGGEMDLFNDVSSEAEVMDGVRHLIQTYSPEDWDNLKDAELIDSKAWLKGAIRPSVRHPVGTLPSGKKILALADTAMTHEPICGCGANSAIRQVKTLLSLVEDGGDDALNAEVLHEAVEKEYQAHAKYIFDFVHSICGDLNPTTWMMLQAAHHSPSIRNMFANMYSDFELSHRYLKDMPLVESLIEKHADELKDVKFATFEQAFPEEAAQMLARA